MKPLWPLRASSAAYVGVITQALTLLESHFHVASGGAAAPEARPQPPDGVEAYDHLWIDEGEAGA